MSRNDGHGGISRIDRMAPWIVLSIIIGIAAIVEGLREAGLQL